MTIGGRIRELRKQRGYTQERLGEVMYIPKSTISAYENDEIDIKCSVIIELARALNTIPGYFFVTDEEIKDHSGEEAASLLAGIKDPIFKQAELEHLQVVYSAGVQYGWTKV